MTYRFHSLKTYLYRDAQVRERRACLNLLPTTGARKVLEVDLDRGELISLIAEASAALLELDQAARREKP